MLNVFGIYNEKSILIFFDLRSAFWSHGIETTRLEEISGAISDWFKLKRVRYLFHKSKILEITVR